MDEQQARDSASAVYETAAAFERALHAAHKLGLRVDVRVEQIGDCTSTRQRPDIAVEVYQPLPKRRGDAPQAGVPAEVHPADLCEIDQFTTHESLRSEGAVFTATVATLGEKAFYREGQTQYFKRVK